MKFSTPNFMRNFCIISVMLLVFHCYVYIFLFFRFWCMTFVIMGYRVQLINPDQSINPSFHRSIKQSINWSIYQSINRSINQSWLTLLTKFYIKSSIHNPFPLINNNQPWLPKPTVTNKELSIIPTTTFRKSPKPRKRQLSWPISDINKTVSNPYHNRVI